MVQTVNALAPIALFVYNRPWHTRQNIEALQKNELASESDLIVFADGEKERAESKGPRAECKEQGRTEGKRKG